MLLYPIAITLIILIFTDKLFGGAQSVYIGAMVGTTFVAILDALQDAKFMVEEIDSTFSFIPLFTSDAGWIITGLLGAIIGYFFKNNKQNENIVQGDNKATN